MKDASAKKYNILGQERLQYEGISDPSGGLKGPFSLMQQQPGEFESMLQQQARSTGIDPATGRQLEAAQAGQLGLQAESEEALAMRGGLGGGSRERLAESGMQNLALQQQGIRQAGEEQRLGLQQKLAGVEAERARSDVEAARADQARKQEFGLRQFEKESEAIAAMKSAKAQAKAACFLAGTPITMEDGSKKPIEKIDIEDELMHGGFVYGCGKAIGSDFYNYNGVTVTGSHAVFENGKWVRVADSKVAEKLDLDDQIVYMVACENHTHIINGILFSDYDEIDEGHSVSDEERLVIKNKLELMEAV